MSSKHAFEIGELVYWDPGIVKDKDAQEELNNRAIGRGVGIVIKQWEPTSLREDLRIPHYEIYWTKTSKTLPECEANLTCAVGGRFSKA